MAKRAAKTETLQRYVEEIDRFATLLRDSQEDIRKLEEELAVKKDVYEKAKAAVREAKEVEHSTVALLLKFVTPGSVDILPLFDTMEPANEEKQGVGSTEWRREPIAVLKLSAVAMRALIAADIVLVGQLQDLMIADREDWFREFEGITSGMAEAIEAKFHSFVEERSEAV